MDLIPGEEVNTDNLPTVRGLINFLDGTKKIVSVPVLNGFLPEVFVNEESGKHFHFAGERKNAYLYEECNGQEK